MAFPCHRTGWCPKVLASLSELCFSAYLVSAVFDDLVYNVWGLVRDPRVYRLEYIVLTVPLVFVCSLLLAGVIRILYKGIQRAVTALRGQQ